MNNIFNSYNFKQRIVSIPLFFLFTNLWSQNGALTIKILEENIVGENILCLKCFQNGSFSTVDSITISNQNKDRIAFNYGDYFGTCELNFFGRDKPGAEFIVNPKEQIEIQATLKGIENGKINITKSIENELYGKLKKVRNIYDRRLNELLKLRGGFNPLQKDFYRKIEETDLKIERLKDTINLECDKITSDYPNLFVNTVTKNMIKLPTRTSSKILNEYDTHDAFLHDHYFDFIDFSSSNTVRHYALTYLIEQYFSQYSSTKDKFLFHSIDILMKKAEANSEVKNFIYNFLLDYGITRNMEYLVSYIQDNYGDDCQLGIDFGKSGTLKAINDTKIGALAPDILLYDLAGNPQSLKQFVKQNKYTILIFWINWCVHCQKELPIIAENQMEWKKKGIGVFSVCLDEKKEDWEKGLEKYKLTGINVSEGVPLKQSKVLPAYNIFTTPALFIIDAQGKILEKNIFNKQLLSYVNNQLK